MILLEKKRTATDSQPACFAFFSESLGVDDLTPRASPEDIREARERAFRETEQIVSGYKAFLRGEDQSHAVALERLADRLDLKFCVPMSGRLAPTWRSKGIEVRNFESCVLVAGEVIRPLDSPEELFKLIKVTYDGKCEIEKLKRGRAIRPRTMYKVAAGQMVFSTIRATDGAIGIVPPELDGALVSDTSYRVFDCETPQDAAYLWAVLRSHEIRADMQSLSPGSSRYNTPWPEVGAVLVPWPRDPARSAIGEKLLKTWEQERQLEIDREASMSPIKELGVESPESVQRWNASKAPK